MKNLLDTYKRNGLSISAAAEQIFATVGNGIHLDQRGYISGNYRSDDVVDLPEPEPLSWIYPWTTTESCQPFRKLAGCRDKGFKELAQYFINCVMMTDDSLERIKDWKDNIEVVKSVVLDTPTIQDKYTDPNDIDGFISTLNSLKDSVKNSNNSVKKVWFFDVQWSDCPQEVAEEVRHVWHNMELGNDYYIYKTEVDLELFEEYPRIYYWLKYKGVNEGEPVIIHWWW